MKSVIARLLSSNPPDTLYHYTSQAGAIGILTKKEIWASKIQYLNDSLEFNLPLGMVTVELARQLISTNRKSDKRAIEEMQEDVESIEQVNVCVASFSEEDDLLSQWRAYCADGVGFSIGFDAGSLQKIGGPLPEFSLAKCSYNPFEHASIVQELVKYGLRRKRSLLSSGSSRQVNPVPPFGNMPFRDAVTFCAPLIKHEKFHEEAEWRLISTPLSVLDSRFGHRPGRSFLIPYYRLPLETEDGSVKIKEVIVGPCPHPELSESSAYTLLQSTGINGCSVRQSEVPFRNW
jgi:Protein of unknown function (DUF2971)